MGLRRGFLQAGAQHLLMTLWPISDETTVQIMIDFYDATRRTANPPQVIWPRKRVQAVAQFWLLLDKCKGLVTLSWFLLFFDILVCFKPITIRCAQGRNPA